MSAAWLAELAVWRGSVRGQDAQAALDPARAPVDDRDLAQLLCFIADFARQLRDVGDDGATQGDWQVFLRDDISFLLARILCFDPLLTHAEANRVLHSEAEPSRRDRALLHLLFGLFTRVSDWALAARDISASATLGTPLGLSLENLIRQQLSPLYLAMLHHPEHPEWAQHWAHWQAAWQAGLAAADADWLLGQWRGSGDADLYAAPELYAVHVSFVERIGQSLPPMRHYFDASLADTFGHQPHTALLIAFARLLRHAQADANALTGRHLDFYYQTVLRLSARAPQPDQGWVSLLAAPGQPGVLAPAGLLLDAGQQANGQPLRYALDQALVVNQDRVAQLCAVRAEFGADGLPARLCAAPVANSANGQGAPLAHPAQGWPAFGPGSAQGAADAEVGLLITSPLLSLRGGRRSVRLRLQYDPSPATLPDSPFQPNPAPARPFADVADDYLHAVRASLVADGQRNPDAGSLLRAISASCTLWLSTAAGWRQADNVAIFASRDQAWVEVRLTLAETFPAVAPAAAGVLPPGEAGADSPWPRLKLLLNPNAAVPAYGYLQQLSLTGMRLDTVVSGLAPQQLANQQSLLDTRQPFAPLGHAPTVGSYLTLSDAELASKPITRASVDLDWFNLPADLASYYAGYPAPTPGNGSFQGAWRVDAADGSRTQADAVPLFTASADAAAPLAASVRFALPAVGGAAQPWRAVSLQLTAPADGFGHAIYPQVLATVSLRAAAAISREALQAATNPAAPPPASLPKWPNAPYTPQASAVRLNYSASATLHGVRQIDDSGVSQACFYHLGPFGHRAASVRGATVLPGLATPGQLYIGLSGLQAGQTVSLLFGMQPTELQQAAQRQGWPGASQGPGQGDAVSWFFLGHDQWWPFAPGDILSDSSEALTGSGMVRLQTHEGRITADNTLMPAGCHWLAAISQRPDAHSQITVLDTQAASITQVLTAAQPDAAGPLPAGSIQALVVKPRGLQGVQQALATVGGQAGESLADFRTRISQRLRHKARCQRARDLEQLALELFPEVGQAKCITPNHDPRQQYLAPPPPAGRVGLVVAPCPVGSPRPALPVSSQRRIRDALLTHCPPGLRDLWVFAPEYETVKICAQLTVNPSCDFVYLRHTLNTALSAWLAPWRSDARQPLPIGGDGRSMNDLYVYLADQPDVDTVEQLFALHVYTLNGQRHTRWLSRDDALTPSSPWAALIPADNHTLTRDSLPYGIGQLTIGADVMVFDTAPADSAAALDAAAPPPEYTLALPLTDLPALPLRDARHDQTAR